MEQKQIYILSLYPSLLCFASIHKSLQEERKEEEEGKELVVGEKTRPDTRLPTSRLGGQGQ